MMAKRKKDWRCLVLNSFKQWWSQYSTVQYSAVHVMYRYCARNTSFWQQCDSLLFAVFNSETSFWVFGASSFISFCNCRKAAFKTTLSSSNTATLSLSSSIRESRDATISAIAELLCCDLDNAFSSSSTLLRSDWRALSNVDRARFCVCYGEERERENVSKSFPTVVLMFDDFAIVMIDCLYSLHRR